MTSLQNHDQSSNRNQNATNQGFHSKILVEKDKSKNECEDNTKLINRNDLGGFSLLQCSVITEPGSARR